MREVPLILVVDDVADNRQILKDRLESEGYAVALAGDGEEALAAVAAEAPDLVLLDVMMPNLDGIETVKRLKAPGRPGFLPVILVTSRSDTRDIVAGLEAGADEYLAKPFDHAALLARVRAMLRLKALQDRLQEQADLLQRQSAELATLNDGLNARVAAQIGEIERVSRLKRFLSPQIVDAILASSTGEEALRSHRADVVVVFTDLRQFTTFAATADPEDVIGVLAEYHAIVGEAALRLDGTLERFAGDGVMVLFNDPVPCPEPCRRAVEMALAVRTAVATALEHWRPRGAPLGLGIGIAAGHATVGRIGFRGRFDYAAIGPVTNLAARLCEIAQAGEILVSARVAHEVRASVPTTALGARPLKGFLIPSEVHRVSIAP